MRAERFRFEEVRSALYKAIRFKDLPPDRLTVYQSGIVGVYLAEKNFHDSKKDWARQQAISQGK